MRSADSKMANLSSKINVDMIDQQQDQGPYDEFNSQMINTNQGNEIVYPEQYFKNMPVG